MARVLETGLFVKDIAANKLIAHTADIMHSTASYRLDLTASLPTVESHRLMLVSLFMKDGT